MIRNAFEMPDEYTTALGEWLRFDLSPASLSTRSGKEYIAQKAEIVSQITEGLTTHRDTFLASGYLKQKKIREAYALYYMTTNLLKIVQPLREISHSHFFEHSSSLRVLDLGTGIGAAAWGALTYFLKEKKNCRPEIMLTDSLGENLFEAEDFSRHFIPRLSGVMPKLSFAKFNLWKPNEIPEAIKKQAPFHLILMMNVLNELDEANDQAIHESVMSLLDANGAIIIIEPATRLESRRLLRFRDMAVTLGATIYSPCTRQADCPALIKDDDWCHTDVAWMRPKFIEAIDDIVGTLRLSLKYSYIILRKDELTLSKMFDQKNLYRIVSERFNEKGRIRSILCGENGRYEHVINKRDLSSYNKDFTEIQRYDLVSLEEAERREHDIRLLKDSKFSIVLPNLGAQ